MKFLDSFIFSLMVLLSLKWARSFYYLGDEGLAAYMLFLIILYFIIAVFFKNKISFYLKSLVIIIAILIIVVIPMVRLTVIAQKEPTVGAIHDGAIQTKEAIKFLLDGKNPYRENYEKTPLFYWNLGLQDIKTKLKSAAIYHFIYLPFLIVFSTPFYLISELLIGFYDQRFVSVLVMVISLILIFKLLKFQEKKLFIPILIFLNPLFTEFLIWGVNDVFVLALLVLTFYLLQNKKTMASSFVLGLACATKQVSFLFVPLFFAYLYLKKAGNWQTKVKLVLKESWLFSILFIIALPFFIWSPKDFFEDIFQYPAGTSSHIVGIVGYGFSKILLELGIIKYSAQYFPFIVFQFAACVPLFFYLLKIQKNNNSIRQVFFSSTILLSTFLYFSRFLMGSYISLLFVFFISVYLFDPKKNEKSNNFDSDV